MNGATTTDQLKPSLVGGLGFYFGGEDALRVTSWNSLAGVALVISGRFLGVDGHVEPFVETHTPATNRTAVTTTHGRGCGWLSDLSIVVSGAAPQRGQTFARVDVVRGLASSQIVLSTILQGYVTATKRLAYPGSPIEDSLAGQGVIRSITGTDPGAGVEIAETVPTGARWRLQGLRASLVTSVAVANRNVMLAFDDGANIYAGAAVNFNHAASLTFVYHFGAVGQSFVQTSAQAMVSTMPNIVQSAGHRFRTSTSAIDAADNWGPPQYAVEEWLEAV